MIVTSDRCPVCRGKHSADVRCSEHFEKILGDKICPHCGIVGMHCCLSNRSTTDGKPWSD